MIFNDMHGGKPVYRLATHYAFSDDQNPSPSTCAKGSSGPMVKPRRRHPSSSFNLVKANKALDERPIWTQIKKPRVG